MVGAICTIFICPKNLVTIGWNNCTIGDFKFRQISRVIAQVIARNIHSIGGFIVQFYPVFVRTLFVNCTVVVHGNYFIEHNFARYRLASNLIYKHVVFRTCWQITHGFGCIVGSCFNIKTHPCTKCLCGQFRAINTITRCAVVVRTIVEHFYFIKITSQSGGMIQGYFTNARCATNIGRNIRYFVVDGLYPCCALAIVQIGTINDRRNLRYLTVAIKGIDAVGKKVF